MAAEGEFLCIFNGCRAFRIDEKVDVSATQIVLGS